MHLWLRACSQVSLGLVLYGGCARDGLRTGPDAAPGPEAASTAGPDLGREATPDADGGRADEPLRSTDTRPPSCGDGNLDRGEGCDDGNTVSGDGCSADCQLEDGPGCPIGGCVRRAVCGNGIVTSAEACDDGNTSSGDGCSADCQTVDPGWHCPAPGARCVPVCGDRMLRGTETCDDGNQIDGDGCSIYCLTEPGWDCTGGTCVRAGAVDGGVDVGGPAPRCGDEILSGAEECDWGSLNDDDEYGGCSTKCFYGPYCGDGIRNGPEACDLGRQNGAVLGKDGCTIGCTTPHYCGDGLVDVVLGEECDFGDLNGVKLDVNGKPTDDAGGFVYCDLDCRIPACCIF